MDAPRTYVAVLARMDGDELSALERQAEELMASEAWQKVAGFAEDFRQRTVKNLVHGPTLSHAESSQRLGFISGIEAFPEILRKIREVAALRREGLEAEAAAERAAKDYEEAPLWKPEPEEVTA